MNERKFRKSSGARIFPFFHSPQNPFSLNSLRRKNSRIWENKPTVSSFIFHVMSGTKGRRRQRKEMPDDHAQRLLDGNWRIF